MLSDHGLSIGILSHIFSQKNLLNRERVVWLHIFKYMKQKRFPQVYLSLQRMASELCLSKSTVQRALRGLKKKGYLVYAQINSKNSHSINWYTCIFPGVDIYSEAGIDLPKNKWNWYTVKTDTYEEIMQFNQEYLEMMCNDPNQTSNQSFSQEPKGEPESTQFQKSANENDYLMISQSNIYNKHNIGCEFFSISETEKLKNLTESTNKILENLKTPKENLQKELSNAVKDKIPANEQWKILKKLTDLEAQEYDAKKELERFEKEVSGKLKTEQQQQFILTDEAYIAQKVGKGQRIISPGLLWWVKKQLHSFGVAKNLMAVKLNEVFHAVRFGALSHERYQINSPMPIMKGINIALKLIKSGKWQSPASFNYGCAKYESV